MVNMNQYVMSTCHFKLFYLIYIFRQLIMNIDCEKIIENLDNSENNYRGYIQKIIILQVIQHIFCVILVSERKLLTVICFSELLISGQMFKMII